MEAVDADAAEQAHDDAQARSGAALGAFKASKYLKASITADKATTRSTIVEGATLKLHAAMKKARVVAALGQCGTNLAREKRQSLWGVVAAQSTAKALKSLLPDDEREDNSSDESDLDDDDDVKDEQNSIAAILSAANAAKTTKATRSTADPAVPSGWSKVKSLIHVASALEHEEQELAQLENDGIDSDESDSDDDESGDDEEEANASGGLGAAINAIRFTSTLKKNAEQRAEEARKRWGATKGALQFVTTVKKEISADAHTDTEQDSESTGMWTNTVRMAKLQAKAQKMKEKLLEAEATAARAQSVRKRRIGAKAKISALQRLPEAS